MVNLRPGIQYPLIKPSQSLGFAGQHCAAEKLSLLNFHSQPQAAAQKFLSIAKGVNRSTSLTKNAVNGLSCNHDAD